MNLLDNIEKNINSLENSKISFIYFILTFLFATTLRNFLETFSTNIPISLESFSHFDISYVFLALALIILFHIATKERIEKIARIILPCFLILMIVPIIDLAISGGEGYEITYMFPQKHKDLAYRFITFFGSDLESGITPGIKTEVALVLLGSFIYFYIKKRGFIKSLFFSFLIYSLIFIYLAMPFVMEGFFGLINWYYDYSSLLLRNFYIFLIFFLLIWIFFLYKKEYLIEIIKDIRPFRLLHFELMFFLGTIWALLSDTGVGLLNRDIFYYFNRVFVMISVLFAWLFSVITNNLTDFEIDKVVSSKRPLVSKKILKRDYRLIAGIFFILSLIYSVIVSFEALFLITLFIGNYFLYSMPPLRLKRIPFFSKLFISLNSLILFMLGYFFVVKNIEIPTNIIFLFLIFFTAAFNFIDIKDYKGDKKVGIKTLPVIFGLRKSKIIIGLFFLIAYFAVWFIIIKDIFFLPFLFLIGLIQFFLINKKNYKESSIFLVYFLTIFLLIIYLTKYLNVQLIGV